MELSMRLAALQLHQLHSDPIFVRENLRKAGKTCGKPGGNRGGNRWGLGKYASQAICICTPQTVRQNLRTQQTRTTSAARNMLNYEKTKNQTRRTKKEWQKE